MAAGVGKHGPYAVATHRVKNVGTVKATTGTKGTTIGIKRRIGNRKHEVGYNFTTKSPYYRSKKARRPR